MFLSFASYPFAYTFASLSSCMPQSGGVYSFAKEGFGQQAATVTSWLFALWYIAGSPAVTLIAASYLAYAFPMSRTDLYLVAAAVIVLTFVVNYRGITFSNKVQLGVVISIVLMLVAAVATSVSSVEPGNFTPLFPNGILPVGTAAALIFWSYLGYENVSNVAEEFKNPERDFRRSVVISVLLIGVPYVSVAVVTVGTRAYEVGGA
ncbi:MAG: amino acid permease [Bacteroidetes bacterium]|nr:amino acid permease [Bacteroidota bacterium]